MNNKGLGLGFIAIAAFLYAMRFLCAAAYGSHTASWGSELFNSMYVYVGPDLTIASGVAGVTGFFFLLRGDGPKKDEPE